jgi:hypothetical protein
MAATFSKGVYIPELLFIAFQATFAGITCCLIVGAFAERIKFSAVLLFSVMWFTFSYAADRPHGVVLDGPGRLCQQGSRRRDERQGRPDLAAARSTSPAARWCTSTPPWRAWWAPT